MGIKYKNIFFAISDHFVAIALVILSMAGAIRIVFALNQALYYIAIAVLVIFTLQKLLFLTKIPRFVGIYILLSWLFFIWMILSISWSSASQAFNEDLFLVVSLLVILTSTGVFVEPSTIEKYIKYFVVGSLIVTSFVIVETGGIYRISGYGTIVSDEYLTLAMPQGLALAISVFHFTQKPFPKKIFWLIVCVVFIIGLGISLARGSLVFSVISIVFVSSLYLWQYRGDFLGKIGELLKHFFIIALIIGGLIVISSSVQRTATRVTRMLDISYELRKGGRGEIWLKAWQGIKEAPLVGHGLGMSREISRPYPHNMFLQVWVDSGIIGAVLLLALLLLPLFIGIKKIKKCYKNIYFLSLVSLSIILVLEFSKSFDFYTARPLLIVSMLSVSYIATIGNKNVNSN